MPEPNKIPRAFAASGDKNSIPDSSGSPGFASWQEGFPAITSEPFAQGGIAPKRADFNGIFNALSLAILWQQQGGFYAYDNTTDYEVGNVVVYSNNLYKCLVANGPNSAVKAPTDTTVWGKVMTSADVAAAYLPLSGGTLTGNLYINNLNIGGSIIQKINDTGGLYGYGGTGWNHGAQGILYGKSHATNPGDFVLHADDGVNTCDLLGRPNGALTWGGKDVFTSDNCTVTSATGSTPYSYKAKFANGLMVQCYYGTPTTDENSRFQWTYDEAFIEDPFVSITNGMSTQALNLYNWNKTRIIVNVCDTTGGQAGSSLHTEMVIIALGRWK